jgi:HPt (histidine-containing phosphotransfer) domain-containing protein
MDAREEQPPIDLQHLARYTGGDASLDAEILQLFETQSALMLKQIQTALETLDTGAWRQVLHQLKGAARGIGAFALADIAAHAESIEASDGQSVAILESLVAESERARGFIRNHLSR